MRKILREAEVPASELRLLAGLQRLLEHETFETRKLRVLQGISRGSWTRPSDEISRLAALLDWNTSRRNPFFLPLAALTLTGTQVALAIERWRDRVGERAGEWMAAIGEAEALNALAVFAFEHEDYCYPELLPAGARFDAKALGHPLLAADRCVVNDVALDRQNQLLVVTGSNMSGKSTLLRSVGVNTILALAGAPVHARALKLSPLTVGPSLRVQDSLRHGVSRFYAEISRLAEIKDQTGRSVLFLLDEILQGTNSEDRRQGAVAVVRDLLECGGIGLVTTHDLVLASELEEKIPEAANVSFGDSFADGRIVFDYKLRSGPVEKGNALELIRSLGFEV